MSDQSSNSNNNNSTVSIRGTDCYVHRWDAKNQQEPTPRALVVIFHGFLAHGAYPTVRYAAEFLSEAGYTVISIDFPGHGKSDGMRGYVKSADSLIEDGIEMVRYAINQQVNNSDVNNNKKKKKLRLVLCGSSMGGAIALSVAQRLSGGQDNDNRFSGGRRSVGYFIGPDVEVEC